MRSHQCHTPSTMCPSLSHPTWVLYLLPLHHIQKISKGRVLGIIEGQQGQRALHLCQALPALLPLLRQLRLRELQRRLRLPLADQLDQVLLLVRGQGTQTYTPHLGQQPLAAPGYALVKRTT